MKAWGTLLALSFWCPFHHTLCYHDRNRSIKHQLFANRTLAAAVLWVSAGLFWDSGAGKPVDELSLLRAMQGWFFAGRYLQLGLSFICWKSTLYVFKREPHVCMCIISLFSLEVNVSVCHNKVSIMVKVIIISIHKFLWRLKSRSIDWGKERSMHSIQGRKKIPLYGWPLLSTFRCCTFFEIWLKEKGEEKFKSNMLS